MGAEMTDAADELDEPTTEAEPNIPDDVLSLMEAAETYAAARCKLPAPGKQFHGPDDAKNFKAYFVALLAYERAAMAFAGKKISQ